MFFIPIIATFITGLMVAVEVASLNAAEPPLAQLIVTAGSVLCVIWLWAAFLFEKFGNSPHRLREQGLGYRLISTQQPFATLAWVIHSLVFGVYLLAWHYRVGGGEVGLLRILPQGFFVVGIFEVVVFGFCASLAYANMRANQHTVSLETQRDIQVFNRDALRAQARSLVIHVHASAEERELEDRARRIEAKVKSLPMRMGAYQHTYAEQVSASIQRVIAGGAPVTVEMLNDIEEKLAHLR